MGDALFVHGGVTDAQEARLALAGLFALQGPGLFDVRTGVMFGPASTALVTGTAATAPMTVSIVPHNWLASRGPSNGPYLGALTAATTVNIGAAPGSGTRVDVVYVKQVDNTPGVPTPDAAAPAPFYGVLAGTVGAGKPSLAGIVGAEELATVAVSAGATATNGANVVITNTARQAGARGAPLRIRSQTEQDALNPTAGDLILRLDTGRGYVYFGGAWVQIFGPLPAPTALPMVAAAMANFGATFSVPRYSKDLSGFVHLMGFAKLIADIPAATQKTVVAVGGMPAGFRPTAGTESVFGTYNGLHIARFDINPDGSIILVNNTAVNFAAAGSFIQLPTLPYPTFG